MPVFKANVDNSKEKSPFDVDRLNIYATLSRVYARHI
jgi:hypothetical protein